jgi:GntR family transcriptional regulator/MocR family aminotransferase
MRKAYKNRRNRLVEVLNSSPIAEKITILEQDAGLHFLLRIGAEHTDEDLTAQWAAAGIRIRALSDYYHGPTPEEYRRCLVADYSGLTDEDLHKLENRLKLLVR